MNRRALSFLVALLFVACQPQSAPSPSAGFPFAANETPLAAIRDRSGDFAGRSVTTRGWLVRSGEAPAGPWLELVGDPSEAAPRPLLVVLSAAVAPGDLHALEGKQLELGLGIEGPVVLPDGRSGVRALPEQITTAITPVAPGAGMPAELAEQLETVSEGIRQSAAETFRDPRAAVSRSDGPAVRLTFLDPELRKPLWSRPGPVAVERSGPPDVPSYVYRETASADDGGARLSVCRFRVEDGSLRSVAYEETLRDPSGAVVSEERLDFVDGSAFDKLSGKTFPWPKNIYAAPCLPFALSGFPFGDKAVVNFFLWSDYDPFTTMYAILDGQETVTVPAGTFEAFRIRMNVNTEHIVRNLELPMPQAYDMARDVAGQLRPEDTLFWFTAEPPHLFLRMQGPLGAPGTTRGIVERIRLGEEERAGVSSAGR